MERQLQFQLEQYNFQLIQYPNLIVIKFGELYSLVDYCFFWLVVQDTLSQSPEREMVFGPNQLILDFSQNKAPDQYAWEFCSLVEEYKRVKGKNLIICGLNDKLGKFYFEFEGKNYLEGVIKFDSLDEALIYCRHKKLLPPTKPKNH